MQEKQRLAPWRRIAIAVLSVIFAFSLFMLIWQQVQRGKEKADLSALAGAFSMQAQEEFSSESSGMQGEENGRDFTELEREYLKKLTEENPDTVAFLRIEGTNICYPVMCSQEDNEYYLRKNFKKEYSVSGLPFLDNHCDIDQTINLMIYGHHIKNGTMFQNLTYYDDEAYFEEHPQIELFTLSERRVYRIFAAFRSQVYDKESSEFKYYQFFDAQSQEEYDDYVEHCKALSYYDTGITPEYGAQMITLSTCDYHVKNGRFVVVGVLEQES